jgi:hypothetical protein
MQYKLVKRVDDLLNYQNQNFNSYHRYEFWLQTGCYL